MADAILMAGGTGGVSSDDVTASKAHVLKGYKTVTSDSDDEVVEGTIIQREHAMSAAGFEKDASESRYLVRLEEGYYPKRGSWKPCVTIPYAVLANGIGIDANKMLSDSTVAGVRGTIPIRGYRGPNCTEIFMYQADGGYVVRIEEGYYHKSGQWKPYVVVPPTLMKSAVNYHPEKTLSDTRTCEEQGQVKMINTQDNGYAINQAKLFGMDPGRRKVVMQLGHGNAYYYRDDNNPHVEVDASVLGTAGADSVLQWQTATSQHGINFQGAIPRWICTTGGVITALNGEGFVWDDSSGANRGRGIVTRIPDKHFIQDANYVFLASPNFYPQNLVKNININGITGTRDYIDLISPTWLSDATLNLQVNTVEKEIHIPNKFLQYNGLVMKVIVWGIAPDGYYKNSNGGACPCVLAVTNWDGGASFEIKIGAAIFYGLLERQGNGFNDFRLKYRGTMNFNLSMNFLITEGFSHQWAGNYAT